MKCITHILIILFLVNIQVAKGLVSYENANFYKKTQSINNCNISEETQDSSPGYLGDDPTDEFEHHSFGHTFGWFATHLVKVKTLKFYWWGTTKINPLTIDIPPPSIAV